MNQSRVTRYVAYPVTAILMVALATVVLFAACFVLETEKKVAFGAAVAIVAICVTPQFRRRLRERCSIFFLLVTAYILLAGASTFYAYAPKFALSEFSRLLAAYAVFLAVFSFAKRETLPNVVAVLCGAISLLSLLQLDAASASLFADKFFPQLQVWTGGYGNWQYGQHAYGYNIVANRLYGLFGNSNTMATMCGIGIFLSLYLLLSAKRFGRLLPSAALVVNAVTFLMCISLGATMSLGLTVLLVLLCLHGAHNRLSFLLITMETLACAGTVAALCFSRMGAGTPGGYLVLPYCAVGGAALFGLDWLLRPRLINILCRKIKIICVALLSLAILFALATVVALTQTVPVELESNEWMSKRFSPAAGTCEITLQAEGEAHLTISTTNEAQILMGESTTLFSDVYTEPVTLELAEDVIEVQVQIKNLTDSVLVVNSIFYAGSEKSGEIPAGYRWLPDEILTRLQSLTTNHSAMQRLVFMRDGLAMWKQTPIFGRGLGGFENGLASVQSHFYETKYAHNHYVQLLCDLGIIGLILFVSILVFAVRGLWTVRQKDGEGATIFPALLGAMLVFAIHSGLEISASVAECSVFAFGVLGMITHLASAPACLEKHAKPIALGISTFLALFAALYGFFLIQNARAAAMMNQETVTSTQLKQCVAMDVFEGDDYRLTYVMAAMSIQDEEVYQQADQYADELQASHSNAVGPYLTEYYLHRRYYDKAAAASEKFLFYTRSNPDVWNTQFHIFEDAMQRVTDAADIEAIAQIARDTYEQMQLLSEQQLEKLTLDDQSKLYLDMLFASY